MALAIINLLAAFFRAFPRISELVERKQQKDAAVDAAINGGIGNDGKN